MKAAIFGVGRMGQATAWALHELGYRLTLVDSNENNLKKCRSFLWSRPEFHGSIVRDASQNQEYTFLKDIKLVISALPFHQNEELSNYCINNNITYCDLGGNVEFSRKINNRASVTLGATVMTDLGLAPGWVNILAEHGYNIVQPVTNIEMMVGGLPLKPNNYLKYNCTWSHDGLINEYRDTCTVINDGLIAQTDGMTGLRSIETKLGKMEAFYTSGGVSHTIDTMKKRGVKNCSYRTIRYPGHCDAVRFLINDCGLNDEELIKIFTNSCPPADDLVIIKVIVDSSEYEWEEEIVIECNDKFSAMQMATAFPLVSAAHAIRDIKDGGSLTYKDIPYKKFSETLEFLFHSSKEMDNA